MAPTVTLLTDRPDFTEAWRAALANSGAEASRLATQVVVLDALVGAMDAMGSSGALVIDCGSAAMDEDALLETVGYARACNVMCCLDNTTHSGDGADIDVDDVLDEMCEGRVARTAGDVSRLVLGLARRLDATRSNKFEFVTISPREGEILAILGDGNSVLLRRPISSDDDGSDVETIELEEQATRAVLGLASGQLLALEANSVGPAHAAGSADVEFDLDGARLGARLKALRLEAGLTQAELARRTGIHRPNIARVEAGRHTPSLETLSRLANAIGVPASKVLSQG